MKTKGMLVCLVLQIMMGTLSAAAFCGDGGPNRKKSVDLNCASIEQLCCLPEIDRRLATEIIRYRVQKGLFKSKEDLLRVPGITTVLLEKISPWLMEIPSNTCIMPDSHPGDHDWEEQPVKNIPNC